MKRIVQSGEGAADILDVSGLRLKSFLDAVTENHGADRLTSEIANLSPVLQNLIKNIDRYSWLPAGEEIKITETLASRLGCWDLIRGQAEDLMLSMAGVFLVNLPHRARRSDYFFRLPSVISFYCTHLFGFLREQENALILEYSYRSGVKPNAVDGLFLQGIVSGYLKLYRLHDIVFEWNQSAALRPENFPSGAEPAWNRSRNTIILRSDSGLDGEITAPEKEGSYAFVDQVISRTRELLRDKRELMTAVEYLNMANNELEKEIRLNKKELNMARNIQKGFVPQRIPDWKGLQFWTKFFPLTEVSGDFYDYMSFGSNRLAVVVGDVSGHGVPAALISAIAKLSFTNHKLNSPAEILSKVNLDLLNHVKREGYLTCFYMIVDSNYNIIYSVGAAPPPLLYRAATDSVEKLPGSGTMLGMFPDANELFFDQSTHLEPGDKLFIYTDGLVEARNAGRGEIFGEARVMEAIRRTRGLDAQGSSEMLMSEYEAFTLGAGPTDDLTIITLMLSERQDEFDELVRVARDFQRQKDYKRACEKLRAAIEIFPRHTSTLYLLGKYLALNREFEESVRYLNEYNKLNAYNADAYTISAYCYYRLGNYQKAHDELKRSLSLRNDNPAALYNLILVYMKLNRTDEARNIFSALEYLRPEHPKVIHLKKRLL